LPNKIFEYIQSELPILTNDLQDCSALINTYGVGSIIHEFTPKGINDAIDEMLHLNLDELHLNLKKAKEHLHWDEEKKILQKAYLTLTS
jgi:hypothetical protein